MLCGVCVLALPPAQPMTRRTMRSGAEEHNAFGQMRMCRWRPARVQPVLLRGGRSSASRLWCHPSYANDRQISSGGGRQRKTTGDHRESTCRSLRSQHQWSCSRPGRPTSAPSHLALHTTRPIHRRICAIAATPHLAATGLSSRRSVSIESWGRRHTTNRINSPPATAFRRVRHSRPRTCQISSRGKLA